MTAPFRIALDAQTPIWTTGGSSTVLLGIIKALGQLTDSNEEYIIICTPQNRDTIERLLGSNQKIMVKEHKQRIYEKIKAGRRYLGRLIAPRRWYELPVSEGGFYESLGCDVIHFPFQQYTQCSIPALFQIYDLQHCHFPQYFTIKEIAGRYANHYGGCLLSQHIVVGSQHVKQDIVENYRIHPKKITVIRNGPPTATYAEPTEPNILRAKYSITEPFILYPSSTRPHKNHIRLLDALAMLRDQKSQKIDLICTGPKNDFFPTIEKHVVELNLHEQVKFLGLVPSGDLRGLYRMTELVIFPSYFEGVGYPPLEAFGEGVAVACSNATSLPEVVGNAGLLFDPYSVDAIANAIQQLREDNELREKLFQQQHKQLGKFDWVESAKTYRALYRKLGHRPLTDEDYQLLGHLSDRGNCCEGILYRESVHTKGLPF